MADFVIVNMPLLMFVSLVAVLVLGYPVSFSLAFLGLGWGVVGIQLGLFEPQLFQALPPRILSILSNETLLAIPFFAFMGLILERSGIAEDLLDTVGRLFGTVRGGVAFAVIIAGALLSATTGIVAATVLAMGLISLPLMLRYGYDRRLAAGVIAASGTLAQIIPPSLVLIVMADQIGRSVGALYQAALLPALILVGLYIVFVAAVAWFFPKAAPAVPPEAWQDRGPLRPSTILVSLALPIALIAVLLGSILGGIATATEAGAIGAVAAVLLAVARRRLSWTDFRAVLDRTVRLSTFVLFILIGARVFSFTFYGVDGHEWIEGILTSIPGGETAFLILVNTAIFILAFFLDFFEIAFIVVPLLVPAAEALGIDLVWFGILLSLNMQTAFLHPPFGFSLYYLRSVAPKVAYRDRVTGGMIAPVTTGQIYVGAVPFVLLQLSTLVVTALFPELTLQRQPIDPGPAVIEVPLNDYLL